MSTAEIDALRTIVQVAQSAGIVLAVVLAAMLTYLTGDALRRLGTDEGVLIPMDGLALRSVIPDVEMTDLRTGISFKPSDMRGGRLLIAFLSGHCRPCKELVPHLNAVQSTAKDTRFIVVVDEGAGELHLKDLDPRISVVEDVGDRPIGNALELSVTPLVYVIDEAGQVAIRAVPNTLLHLEDALDGPGTLQPTAWIPVRESG